MKYRIKFGIFLILMSYLGFSYTLSAGEIWMPVTFIIRPTGVTQKIPLPVTGKTGPAIGNKLGGGFFPTIGGNVSIFRRIFALEDTQNENASTTERPLQENFGMLLPSVSPKGYRVIDTNNKSLTLAGNLTIGPGGWLCMNATLSLGFTIGDGYVVSRTIKTLEEAKHLPSPNVPIDVPNVKKYLNPGDGLAYKQNLNLFINLSGRMGWIFNAGVGGAIATIWNTSIARLEDSNHGPVLRVTYAKEKNKSLSVYTGNLITSFSVSKIWGKSNSFTYQFDLGNPEKLDVDIEYNLNDPRFKKLNQKLLGNLKVAMSTKLKGQKVKTLKIEKVTALMAYQAAIKGDLTLADILSQSNGKYGVKIISEEEKETESTKFSAGVKVPWLISASYSSGKSYVLGKINKLGDKNLVETINGIYSKDYSTSGLLSNDSKRLSIFSGFIQQITPLDKTDDGGNVNRRVAANWAYSYVKNNVTREQILEQLKKVRYQIGFQKDLQGLNVPEGKNQSFSISVNLALSNLATDELMNIAEKYGEKTLINEATTYLDSFVDQYKKEVNSNNDSVAKRELCITKNQTISAMKTAYRALIEMKKMKLSKDYRRFVLAYADFGKGFVENRFTMKTFLRMLRYVCTPNTYHNLIISNPNLVQEDILKVCPEKRITIDGKASKIPYKIEMKIEGTLIQPWSRVLYSHENRI